MRDQEHRCIGIHGELAQHADEGARLHLHDLIAAEGVGKRVDHDQGRPGAMDVRGEIGKERRLLKQTLATVGRRQDRIQAGKRRDLEPRQILEPQGPRYVAPAPVYVAPAPVEYEPSCWTERRQVYDADGYPAGSRPVRICR